MRAFDVPVVDVAYRFIWTQIATQNVRCLLELYLRLKIVMQQSTFALQMAVLNIHESLASQSSLPHDSFMDNY